MSFLPLEFDGFRMTVPKKGFRNIYCFYLPYRDFPTWSQNVEILLGNLPSPHAGSLGRIVNQVPWFLAEGKWLRPSHAHWLCECVRNGIKPQYRSRFSSMAVLFTVSLHLLLSGSPEMLWLLAVFPENFFSDYSLILWATLYPFNKMLFFCLKYSELVSVTCKLRTEIDRDSSNVDVITT